MLLCNFASRAPRYCCGMHSRHHVYGLATHKLAIVHVMHSVLTLHNVYLVNLQLFDANISHLHCGVIPDHHASEPMQ